MLSCYTWNSVKKLTRAKRTRLEAGIDGAELQKRRLALGLSQSAFAMQIGVTAGTIAQFEQGRNTVPMWLGKMLAFMEKDAGIKPR
jgi:DNA-binding transcriptional regulator YiaG